jgi:hypothetical protein
MFHDQVTSGLSEHKPSVFFQNPDQFAALRFAKVINILL